MQSASRTAPLMIGVLVLVVIIASSTAFVAYLTYNPRSAAQNVSSGSTTSSITVSGTGQISYTPNEALVQVSVETQNSSASAATSENAMAVAHMIKSLNRMGISNSSIQTEGYNFSPNYSTCYSGSYIPQMTGYSVTNSLQVNITSNDPMQLGVNAGLVIDTTVNAGASGISLSFGATNSVINQLTNEALQNAVSSASTQARAIASSLGVSITGVVSSTQGSVNAPQPFYVYAGAADIVAPSQTPIVPGTHTITQTVQVVYAIS
ncbi:MAG: SIMPL domain-containing protein [Nitrososphaerota archaeon]|nr:SIMPL domain-containing protein [Nitrososphaerota archaeon]